MAKTRSLKEPPSSEADWGKVIFVNFDHAPTVFRSSQPISTGSHTPHGWVRTHAKEISVSARVCIIVLLRALPDLLVGITLSDCACFLMTAKPLFQPQGLTMHPLGTTRLVLPTDFTEYLLHIAVHGTPPDASVRCLIQSAASVSADRRRPLISRLECHPLGIPPFAVLHGLTISHFKAWPAQIGTTQLPSYAYCLGTCICRLTSCRVPSFCGRP